MKLWWTTSIIWLILFGSIALMIGIREVDGSGLVDTPEAKLVSFIILGIAFVLVLICQLIFLIYSKKKSKQLK